MTRVIQDSDGSEDEFDEVDLPADSDVPMARLPLVGPASTHLGTAASGENGTGSTDSLKKAFEAAHRAQFQSQLTPSVTRAPLLAPAPDSSTSLPEHRDKKRKTSAEPSPSTGISVGSRTSQPAKTYGGALSLLSSPFVAQGDHLMFEASVSAEPNAWGLEGSIRDQYAEHDPIALFPEQSSTVPNATATQQRLMAEVLNPTSLGRNAEVHENIISGEPPPSVPWSDYMHETPSGNFEPVSESQKVSTSAPSTRTQDRTPQKSQPLHVQASADLLENEPFRTPKTRSSSTSRGICNLETNVDHDPIPLQTGESHSERKRSADHNDMNMNDHNSNPATSTRTPGSAKTKQTSRTSIPSDDYLESLDLPKEQYKPRPSRSRSSRIEPQESIDYSVRPETVGTRASRRSKTVGGADSSVVAVTPRRVKQICDMGFTPSTTQRALAENNGNVSRAIESLIESAAQDMDELAPTPRVRRTVSNTTKKAHAGNGSISASGHEGQGDLHEALDGTGSGKPIPQDEALAGPPRSSPQVIICKGKPNVSTSPQNGGRRHTNNDHRSTPAGTLEIPLDRKTKRRKTTLDQPETSIEQQPTVSDQIKEKKRSRGKARKDANPATVTTSMTVEAEGVVKSNINRVDDALKEVQSNQDTTPDDHLTKPSPEQTQIPPSGDGVPPPVCTPPAKPMPAGSTRTPEEEPKLANAAPPPLNTATKGKVPYRVGLSKRQRIAPLLKVMKK